jgi:hypothetical protein
MAEKNTKTLDLSAEVISHTAKITSEELRTLDERHQIKTSLDKTASSVKALLEDAKNTFARCKRSV